MFKEKAKYVADKLLPAFNTPTGIPRSIINFKTGKSRSYPMIFTQSSILSEYGTLFLEFSYLSDVTGDKIYREKVEKIRTVLKNYEKPYGLYPNFINVDSGRFGAGK